MPDNDLIRLFNQLFVNEQIPELIDLVNANPETFFGEGLPPLVDNVVKSLEAQELVTRPTAEVISSLRELGDITLGDEMRLTDQDIAGLSTATRSGESDLSMFERMGNMFDIPSTRARTSGRVTDQDIRGLQDLTNFGGSLMLPTPLGPVARNELTAAPTGRRDFGDGRISNQDMETIRGFYPGGDETSNPWNPTTQAEQSFRENVLGDRGVLYGDITPRLQGGGYVGRGTVAGELGRRGRLPVREEEKEKETKHTDYKERDWYARMLQSPTLGKVRIA